MKLHRKTFKIHLKIGTLQKNIENKIINKIENL